MAVKAIPEGYECATPYLCVKGAARAIDFYKQAFGAIERSRLVGPDQRVGYAEIAIGRAPIYLADEHPEIGLLGPLSIGAARPPVQIHLYVEDVDALYQRALAGGAKSLREPADQFFGDRAAQVMDPFGHVWFFATRKEDISAEEMRRRFEAATRQR
jgi:PhnB protein